MSGDIQSRHCWRLMLVVSLAHIADVESGHLGHSRSVLSAPLEAIRVPSGAERHAVHIGYVECAYGGFGEGRRKRYDFVPLHGPARGLVHQGREQLLLRALADGAAMSHHLNEVRHKRKKGRK
jgi:hypothetical protein